MLPPGIILLFTLTPGMADGQVLYAFVATFFILSSLANGLTIAMVDFF
jgi:hypothetical protein